MDNILAYGDSDCEEETNHVSGMCDSDQNLRDRFTKASPDPDPEQEVATAKEGVSISIVVENTDSECNKSTKLENTAIDNEEMKDITGDEAADDGFSEVLHISLEEPITEGEEVSEQTDCSQGQEESDTSDTETSSSSESDDSSDDSFDVEIRSRNVDLLEEINVLKTAEPPKVKGEILACELPPVEDVNVTLPEDAMLHPVGKISQIMNDYSVVVQSHPNKPALDYETVLFLSHSQAIGKVEETFGPVPNPYYIIRFNSEEHLSSKGAELGKEVYYAPDSKHLTTYVFMSTLKQMRGSDASWSNDTEPPLNCLDYSDDEKERKAKKALKGDRAKKETAESDEESKAKEQPHPTSRRSRGRGRVFNNQNQWHNESQRFNVMPLPNPEFEGWNAAVNRMAYCRSDPTVPTMLPLHLPGCMNGMPARQMPPNAVFGAPPRMGFQPPNYFTNPNFGVNWSGYQGFSMNAMNFRNPPPPPPPN